MAEETEKQKGEGEQRDNDFNQNIADSSRLIKAGLQNKDDMTASAGAARILKATNGNITPEMAKALGLDQLPIAED